MTASADFGRRADMQSDSALREQSTNIRRFVRPYVAMAVVFCVFFVAVYFSFQTLFDQKRLIEKESKINVWFLAQTEIEYLRLIESLYAFRVGDVAMDRDGVVERFEIFWSRLPILLEGKQSSQLRDVEGVVETANNAIGLLEELEPSVGSLERRDAETITQIIARLGTLREPLHEMVQKALIYDADIRNKNAKLHEVYYYQLLALFATLLVGGGVLFVMFHRQIHRAERLSVEARAAEATTRKAREQLVVAIGSMSEGFIIYDEHDRVLLFNEKYVELHPAQADILRKGISFADLLRESVARGGVNVPAERIESWVAECVSAHRNPDRPFDTQLSTGTWLKISEQKTPDGGIVGIHTDITERKRREAEITGKSDLLQAIISNIDQGIAVFDKETRLVSWNERFAILNGLQRDRVKVGLRYKELMRNSSQLCSADGSLVERDIDQHLHIARDMVTQIDRRYSLERRNPDGTVIEIRVHAMPDGGFIKTYRDITERVRAEENRTQLLEHKVEERNRELTELNLLMQTLSAREEELRRAYVALREREERLNAALLASRTSTYRWNLITNAIEEDESVERLMGVDGAQIRNLDDYYKYVHPDDRAALERAAEDCAREGNDLAIDYRLIRPDGDICWVAERGKVFFDDSGNPEYMTGAIVDITERKKFEEHQRLLVAELSHRVKNTLAVVQSIALQTLRRSQSLEAFRETFIGRVSALSKAHSLLTRSKWQGADLRDLMVQILAPYRQSGTVKVITAGDPVQLRPKPAIVLALVFHELATNAVKYGSLSVGLGCLRVSWEPCTENGLQKLRISWIETGGPEILSRSKPGFGSALIERSIERDLDGTVCMSYRREGLACEIELPLTAELVFDARHKKEVHSVDPQGALSQQLERII